MLKSKKNAFTLIELIATLVIMAIIALIVTPLVMTIIRKARISADKRSIDAYGRSIELAIAGYLLDTGNFPADISQLTIEYSGDEVVCTTTQINPDSSLYLAGCKVNNRDVAEYTYGADKKPVVYEEYSVGDEVTYNNVDYYVIKDSGVSDSTVTLLKAEPLTVAEVNQFGGVGTANNHVNMYSSNSTSSVYYHTAYDSNGYGGMAYYSSSTCGYNGSTWVEDGCINEYNASDIKYVVDAWKSAQAPSATEARLITFNELINDYNFEYYEQYGNPQYRPTENTPTWIYSDNYRYWTMSPDSEINSNSNSNSGVIAVDDFGIIRVFSCYDNCGGYCIPTGTVRPVIVLPKSAL